MSFLKRSVNMNQTKTNRAIFLGAVALIFIIMFFGLFDRFSYESKSKKLYMCANYTDISAYEVDGVKTMKELKKAGVNFVSVEPVMLSELVLEKKVDVVSYSSLKINSDEASKDILNALGNDNFANDSLVIISSDIPTSEFLKDNLSVRYENVTEKQVYDNVSVFLMNDKTKKDDFIVGYSPEAIQKVKESGLLVALDYPAYTFSAKEYGDFISGYILLNDVKFIILRESEFDNKLPLSDAFLRELADLKTSLVIFENENQVRNEEPYLYKELKPAFYSKIVRGFNMDKVVEYDKTKYRYRYYQWYNSAIERNTTFINVNILRNKDTDFEENKNLTLKAVSDFRQKTQKLGYVFENDFFNQEYPNNMKLFSMCGGVLIVLLLVIYLTLVGIKIPNIDLAVTFSSLLMILLSYGLYDYVTRYYACILMILIISIFTFVLFKLISLKRKYVLYEIAGLFFGFVLFSSLVISAMYSDFEFFVGEKWVFGVKISLLTPFLTTAYNYNAVFLKIKSFKELIEKSKEELRKIPKYILITAGILFLAVLGYYLVRTGKSSLILPFEDIMRKKLTDIFAIRPRTKEFLIGYPLFFLFVYFCIFRKNKTGALICGIFSTVLFTSVLNTFSHAFTRYLTSFIRFINGLICGVLVSGVIIGTIELIIYIRKRITKRDKKPIQPKKQMTEVKKAQEPKKTVKKKPSVNSGNPARNKKNKKKKRKK